MSATVTTLTPAVGVEITGLSGSELVDRQAANGCLAALDGHGVVVYREVNIDDDDLLAFSRMLGTLVVQPTGEHKYPEIQTITLDPSKTNVMLAAYRQGNFLWHIDGLTDEVPQKGTLLTACEVDEAGGDTEFANTYAAYDRRFPRPRRPRSLTCGWCTVSPMPSPWPIRTQPTRSVPLGIGADQGASRGVDPPQRPHVAPARRDRRGGGRLAGGQEPGAAGSPARVVDAAAIHLASQVASGRSRHVGQHRRAPSRIAVRAELAAADASHHARRRGSSVRMNRRT